MYRIDIWGYCNAILEQMEHEEQQPTRKKQNNGGNNNNDSSNNNTNNNNNNNNNSNNNNSNLDLDEARENKDVVSYASLTMSTFPIFYQQLFHHTVERFASTMQLYEQSSWNRSKGAKSTAAATANRTHRTHAANMEPGDEDEDAEEELQVIVDKTRRCVS